MFYSKIITTLTLLSLSTAVAGKPATKGVKPGVFVDTLSILSTNESEWVTDNGYGGTSITNFNFTEVQDRGDPDSLAPYSNSTVLGEDNSTVSAQGCSGCGKGSCVYGKSNGYPSALDLAGKKGTFYLKSDKDLKCSWLNNYFSGFVCPCKSVCDNYNSVTEFLHDYCRRFLKWPSDDSVVSACKEYLWTCCGYPYCCAKSKC
mmetsp:Transcript_26201/g.37562  ORF Transcript_26201/g.37562 Transcript_26201/m.37562 type:complete len:203 (+) Transcript_26201:405-1013(+)